MQVSSPKTIERRQSMREPIAKTSVRIRRSPDSEIPDWAGSGIDINNGGMALVLPLKLAAGTRLFLNFELGDAEFSRVPVEIVRQESIGISAVRFSGWSDSDRLELGSYLKKTASAAMTTAS